MHNDQQAPQGEQPPVARAGLDRRSLLRAGAAATPIIATLYSRPVAAAGCTVASSFVSLATFASRNPGATTMQCSSLTANDWNLRAREQLRGDPAQRAPWATRQVSKYLGRSPGPLRGLDSMNPEGYTIAQVMALDITTSGELGVVQHILALCLSIENGAVTMAGGVNVPYLREVWANYKSNGSSYRMVAANLNWSEGELISWLRMLQYPIAVTA